jgi:hypothetical protein
MREDGAYGNRCGGAADIPILNHKWGCYTPQHGKDLEKIRSVQTRANARKWERSLEQTP